MPEKGTTQTQEAPDLAQTIGKLEDVLEEFKLALRANGLPRPAGGPVFNALRQWRAEQARTRQVPPYIIATDSILRAIEKAHPKSKEELQAIRGVSPGKVATYGEGILEVVAASA